MPVTYPLDAIARDPLDSRRRLIDVDGQADYCPSFLYSNLADKAFLSAVTTIPWRQERIVVYGRRLDVPRRSAWFSCNGHSYTYSNIVHEPQEFPDFLETIRQQLEDQTGYRFNSVLANLYENGQYSVGWHADNEPELGSEVNIASFSLGANRKLRLRHRSRRDLRLSVTLEHNSLLMMCAPMQDYWLHELPKTSRDVGPRVNFSFRNVVGPTNQD